VQRLYVIDGTFELFRSFYSKLPRHSAPDGREVGAVRGMARSLLRLLAQDDVVFVGAAFDRRIESFRNDLFDGYKTGAGIDPDLFGQFPLAEQMSRSLGIATWPMVYFEADDALATAAVRFADEVDQVIICSPDKDLAQCVRGTDIVMFDRIRKKTLDEDGVRAKFGVDPASIPDWLALVGDAADGIPGIERWGAKSSATVLSHYGHISDIPVDPSTWGVKVRGAATLSTNLEAQRGQAELYRVLATLRLDVPIEEDLEALRWQGADRERMEELCRLLDDPGLKDRVHRWR